MLQLIMCSVSVDPSVKQVLVGIVGNTSVFRKSIPGKDGHVLDLMLFEVKVSISL